MDSFPRPVYSFPRPAYIKRRAALPPSLSASPVLASFTVAFTAWALAGAAPGFYGADLDRFAAARIGNGGGGGMGSGGTSGARVSPLVRARRAEQRPGRMISADGTRACAEAGLRAGTGSSAGSGARVVRVDTGVGFELGLDFGFDSGFARAGFDGARRSGAHGRRLRRGVGVAAERRVFDIGGRAHILRGVHVRESPTDRKRQAPIDPNPTIWCAYIDRRAAPPVPASASMSAHASFVAESTSRGVLRRRIRIAHGRGRGRARDVPRTDIAEKVVLVAAKEIVPGVRRDLERERQATRRRRGLGGAAGSGLRATCRLRSGRGRAPSWWQAANVLSVVGDIRVSLKAHREVTAPRTKRADFSGLKIFALHNQQP
ncbi:hypothetical protein FB451DRAFT_1180044 [Mycena latifolia]|nr:hypothetical protein FB451DRAFT_1180044 [Mycena latifolia]